MKSAESLARWFGGHPVLSRKRMLFAVAVAVVTDLVQLGLGPFGWAFADEGLDVLAMILISSAIGFHVLLLPTFVIEFIPGPDMLPTWTGCTAAVIILRKRAQQSVPPPINIATEVTSVPADDARGDQAQPRLVSAPPVLPKT